MTTTGTDNPSRQKLRRQVAELLVVRASGHLGDGQRRYPLWELDNARLQRLLAEGVGGVILLGGSATELSLRTRQLEAWAQAPLLLCADVEEGVGQRFEGATWLVPPLALGRLYGNDAEAALALAERYGQCVGGEARLLGLNWVLAPVCDVNNNAANPVINVRAWGEDPITTGALAAAFIRGAQAAGVLCCAKHFPGHGDTRSDSHLELPLLAHDRQRLEAVELPPFRTAIAAGVASVMTAHLLLPALDRHHPATLSSAVLTGLLRQQMAFGGLIVTDALVMEAIAGRYGAGEAAVLAVEAGADLVLMPADPDAAIDAIVAAVHSGRLLHADLEAKLQRRRRALAQLPPQSQPGGGDGAPLGAFSNGPSPADRILAQELVRRTIVHTGGAVAALTHGLEPSDGAVGLNLLRVDSELGCPFLSPGAPAVEAPARAGFRTCVIDGRGPSPWRRSPDDANGPLALERLGVGPVLLQLFVRGNPFRGGAGGGEEPWQRVIQQLRDLGRLAGLVIYGSPYLYDALKPQLGEEIPAVWSPGQMALAQGEVMVRLGLCTAAAVKDREQAREGGFTD